MLATPLLINWLRARGIGQQIREDGPERHLTKAGTPTMGGLALIGASAAGYLVAHVQATFTTRGLVALSAIGASAGVGLADDWIKVHRQRSLGLNKRAKAGRPAGHRARLRDHVRHLAASGHPPVRSPATARSASTWARSAGSSSRS